MDLASVTSPEEYLALEEASDRKNEFLNGVVVAMAGASPRHNLLVMNLGRLLGEALRSTPCLVLSSDQRVHIRDTMSYVYPDLTVVCGEALFLDDRPRSLTNPQILIEVMSPSTEDHDRGTKLAHYRRLPSVREVLLVSVNEQRVEHYQKLESGQWLLSDVANGGAIALKDLTRKLSLADLYAKIESLPIDS